MQCVTQDPGDHPGKQIVPCFRSRALPLSALQNQGPSTHRSHEKYRHQLSLIIFFACDGCIFTPSIGIHALLTRCGSKDSVHSSYRPRKVLARSSVALSMLHKRAENQACHILAWTSVTPASLRAEKRNPNKSSREHSSNASGSAPSARCYLVDLQEFSRITHTENYSTHPARDIKGSYQPILRMLSPSSTASSLIDYSTISKSHTAWKNQLNLHDALHIFRHCHCLPGYHDFCYSSGRAWTQPCWTGCSSQVHHPLQWWSQPWFALLDASFQVWLLRHVPGGVWLQGAVQEVWLRERVDLSSLRRYISDASGTRMGVLLI